VVAVSLPLASGIENSTCQTIAGVEPKRVMRAVLRGGLGDTAALRDN
jgi:hypothetical protein